MGVTTTLLHVCHVCVDGTDGLDPYNTPPEVITLVSVWLGMGCYIEISPNTSIPFCGSPFVMFSKIGRLCRMSTV